MTQVNRTQRRVLEAVRALEADDVQADAHAVAERVGDAGHAVVDRWLAGLATAGLVAPSPAIVGRGRRIASLLPYTSVYRLTDDGRDALERTDG